MSYSSFIYLFNAFGMYYVKDTRAIIKHLNACRNTFTILFYEMYEIPCIVTHILFYPFVLQ